MTEIISTFNDYLKYRSLGFTLPFDEYNQCQPLLNGDTITMEELYRDYLEFMDSGSNESIRFWI